MPKLKRVSESQLNKDIYDAGEDDRLSEQPDPGRGMTRASQDVMQRRKIIKVSRRKFGTGGGSAGTTVPAPAPAAPAAARRAPAAASSNPFASTTLAAPPATAPSSKANPFAGIALAGSSGSAAAASAPKPAFSFASSAPKPPASTFSFAPTNGANNSTSSSVAAPKAPVLSTPRQPTSSSVSAGGNVEKITQLNTAMLQTVVDHYEGGLPFSDYSGFLKEYMYHSVRLQEEIEDGEGNDAPAAVGNGSSGGSGGGGGGASTNGSSKPAGFSFGGGASATNSSTQPAAFSFGGGAAPAPAAAKPFAAFGGSALAPAGTFSFASKSPAPAAGTSAAPKFSFGGGASSASTSSFGSSAPSAAAGNNDDDPTANPDDGKIEKIDAEENSEEETLYEVRAKRMKAVDGDWQKFGTGILRLYRNGATGKHRMVIRNEIGKVQFNVGVTNEMTFKKIVKDGKKGKAAFVEFAAVEDEEEGIKMFMLQVKPQYLDKLHETLENMVA